MKALLVSLFRKIAPYLVLIFLLSGRETLAQIINSESSDSYSKILSKSLMETENKIVDFIKQNDIHELLIFSNWQKFKSKLKAADLENLKIYLFKKDSILFWTDNSVEIKPWLISDYDRFVVIKLNNGYYDAYRIKVRNNDALFLFRIKEAYAYSNDFLSDKFEKDFNFRRKAEIFLNDSTRGSPVFSSQGKRLFSVEISKEKDTDKDNVMLVLFAIAILVVIFYSLDLYGTLLASKQRYLSAILVITLGAIAIRVLMQTFHFPGYLYSLDIFNPTYYAASFIMRSLGDLLINLAIICWWTYFIGYKTSITNTRTIRFVLKNRVWFVVVLIFLSLLLLELCLFILESLVIDSSIDISLSNIYEFDTYTFLLLLSLLFLFASFMFILERTLFWVGKFKLDFKTGFRYYAIAGLLFLFITLPVSLDYGGLTDGVIARVAIVLSFLLLLGIFKYIPKMLTINGLIIIIIYFSVFSGLILSIAKSQKNRSNLKHFASKFEIEEDIYGKYLIEEIAGKLNGKNFNGNNTRDVEDALDQNYLESYLRKYDVWIRLFSAESNKDSLIGVTKKTHFYKNVKEESENFYSFTTQGAGTKGYILHTDIFLDSNKKILQIGFLPKYSDFPQYYPDILIEKEYARKTLSDNYSYALYQNGRLEFKAGNYEYPYYFKKEFNEDNGGEYLFVNSGDYFHLIYNAADNRKIVVSEVSNSFQETISFFSYIFTFLFLLIASLLLFLSFLRWIQVRFFKHSGVEPFTIYFRTRIQLLMIFLLVVSFILIGWLNVVSVEEEYKVYHSERLGRKVRTISSFIDFDLRNVSDINDVVWNKLVKNLSEINAINLNVYDKSGRLIASSIPAIFEKGLMSPRIAPTGLVEILYNFNSRYIQNEAISQFEYQSVYVPILDDNENIAGILNIPYYANKNDLEKDVSSILGGLINLYVLLFFVITAISPIVSYSITRPLSFISEKLQRVGLGKRNEPITWKSDDEIGQLVKEYNRMLSELEESARQLARSERERAWREMAKQVAHEIKNPLTPMKLSIQHLQRAYKDKAANLDDMMTRVASTLVEQIDHLSFIASEFSSFAKLPKPENEVLEVNTIVRSVANLYGESDTITVTFEGEPQPVYVYADKSQLTRVITNLIQNSVQAIPEDRNGFIKVSVVRRKNDVTISVQDNGIGIPDDQKEVVFQPNFTTKSSGTGLGLAMSWNIINNAKGNIWFESTEGKGTVFYVQIPLYSVHNS